MGPREDLGAWNNAITMIDTSVGRMRIELIEGAETPCLYIHGIPTNSYLWRNVAPLVGRKSLLVDLIGYGSSDKPDVDLSLSAQAKYVLEALDKLDVRNFYCVGHDIGGGVCQILAVTTNRVEGMVLVDSVGLDYWPVPPIARLKDPRWDQFITKVDMRAGIKSALLQGVVKKERITDEVVEAYAKPFEDEGGKRAYLRAARALDYRDTAKIVDELARINTPTLLAWGEQDVYLPLKQGERLAKTIRGAKFVVMHDVGHFSPEDDHELVASLIRGFLEIVEKRRRA